MAYINPEFQLIKSQDQFISLLYYDKPVKSQGIDQTVITEEIKDYMVLPQIDNVYKFKNLEQYKFKDNILHLGNLPDKKRLIIDEDGNIKIA